MIFELFRYLNIIQNYWIKRRMFESSKSSCSPRLLRQDFLNAQVGALQSTVNRLGGEIISPFQRIKDGAALYGRAIETVSLLRKISQFLGLFRNLVEGIQSEEWPVAAQAHFRLGQLLVPKPCVTNA